MKKTINPYIKGTPKGTPKNYQPCLKVRGKSTPIP